MPGIPVAFGDPFACGDTHLFVATPDGLDLWRGPGATARGTLTWSGARGDLWRTGTVHADGRPLCP